MEFKLKIFQKTKNILLILPGEIRRVLIVDKYFAVEGLGEFLVHEIGQLGLVGGEGGLLGDLEGRDDVGALCARVAIEKMGQFLCHFWGQNHIHVQGQRVVRQGGLPGHVTELVLGIVIPSPPLGVLFVGVNCPKSSNEVPSLQ